MVNVGIDKTLTQNVLFVKWKIPSHLIKYFQSASCGECYICKMVAVFREVRRILRKDGTCWLNMGDSYFSDTKGSGGPCVLKGAGKAMTEARYQEVRKYERNGLKPKDLMGVPWRLAFALQADGWWLRSDIIWHKPNPMPESVTDRPTKSHEYLFLLTKSQKYYYDQEAVREPHKPESLERYKTPLKIYGNKDGGKDRNDFGRDAKDDINHNGRNLRTVWTIATEPFPGSHFAVFPRKLVEPCILAGTSEKGCCPKCGGPWVRVVEKESIDTGRGRGKEPSQCRANLDGPQQAGVYCSTSTTGWSPSCTCEDNEPVPCTVLDPFAGSGTVGLVAYEHGREFIGIELSPEYVKMAEKRLAKASAQGKLF